MGILDKIEDKLSGSHRKDGHNEQTGYDDTTNTGDYSTTSQLAAGQTSTSRQHPIGTSNTHGSAITGDTTHGTSGLTGSHGTTRTNVPGSFPGDGNTTTDLIDRTRGDYSTGTTDRLASSNTTGLTGSNTHQNTARQPYNPYSSTGQRTAADAVDRQGNTTAYGASNNRGAAGDVGSRRDYDDSTVPQRGTHGGITNNLKSGPHSDLENRDAIPIAGGEKIGTGAAYQSQSQGYQPQYESGQQNKTTGPHNSDLMNKLDPRVDTSNPNRAHESTTTHGSTGTYGTSDPLHSNTTTMPSTHHQNTRRDQPLSSDPAFTDRHNTTTSGGIGGTNTTSSSYPDTTTDSRTTAPHNSTLLNKLDPRVDSNTAPTTTTSSSSQNIGSSTTGTGSTSRSTGSGGGLLNTRHAGYEAASKSHGGGSYGFGYEKGYEAAYKDALEHVESERRAGRY